VIASNFIFTNPFSKLQGTVTFSARLVGVLVACMAARANAVPITDCHSVLRVNSSDEGPTIHDIPTGQEHQNPIR
jgi:hypothetical protein